MAGGLLAFFGLGAMFALPARHRSDCIIPGEQLVISLHDDLIAAIESRHLERVLAAYAIDAILMPLDAPSVRFGPDSLRSYYANALDEPTRITILQRRVATACDRATVSGEQIVGIDPPVRARYTIQFAPSDGAWRIIQHHVAAPTGRSFAAGPIAPRRAVAPEPTLRLPVTPPVIMASRQQWASAAVFQRKPDAPDQPPDDGRVIDLPPPPFAVAADAPDVPATRPLAQVTVPVSPFGVPMEPPVVAAPRRVVEPLVFADLVLAPLQLRDIIVPPPVVPAPEFADTKPAEPVPGGALPEIATAPPLPAVSPGQPSAPRPAVAGFTQRKGEAARSSTRPQTAQPKTPPATTSGFKAGRWLNGEPAFD